jgi:LAO/AO transport system kinase
VTDSTPAIAHALDAAGFDVVIVETVGTGQDEVEVADVVDTVVVVLMPELGDAIQRAKSGLMEIADILVINKSDLGTTKAEAIHASAKTGEGIPALVEAIHAHHHSLVKSGKLTKRRARAARAEVIRLLQSRVTDSILRALKSARSQKILIEVAKRNLDPNDAVAKLAQEINHVTTTSRRRT